MCQGLFLRHSEPPELNLLKINFSGTETGQWTVILCLAVCDVMKGQYVWQKCILCHQPISFCSSWVKIESTWMRPEKPKFKAEKKFCYINIYLCGGFVTQLVECQTVMPLTQVWFPGAARDFSPRVNFLCRLSYGVRTLPCAIACINICAHVTDPVIHVSVRLIMQTLKHPACMVGWVVWLCHRWLSPGKATWISHERNPCGTKKWLKKNKQLYEACE